MAIFKKPSLKTESKKKREIPQGLWQKCPGCGEVVHEIELVENDRVCPRCDFHFTLSAKDRIANLCDPESFVELDARLTFSADERRPGAPCRAWWPDSWAASRSDTVRARRRATACRSS